MRFRRSLLLALGAGLSLSAGGSFQALRGKGWPTHGGSARHDAVSTVRAQALRRIVWSTPLDLAPQYNGDVLYAHYGSPVVSSDNVVVLPVKTGANGGFRIEARNGNTGSLLWQQGTDYVPPDHGWYPTLGPTIVDKDAAYARKAGIVAFHNVVPDSKKRVPIRGEACFYGLANYRANPAAYDAAVRISSPLVSTDDGSVYFTYRVQGATPLGLKGGIAVVRRDGTAAYAEGTRATGTADFVRPKLNAAPAVAGDTVYAVFKKESGSEGVLVGLSAGALSPRYKTALLDPKNGGPSYVDDDGTACPSVGRDGDVYYGVLENPFGSHHYRGWLLHFDARLRQTKTPGSFGWDDTASLVPSQAVPGYHGDASYLVMTKYNNYAGQGDGVNRVAVLDPNATQTDPLSGVTSMKEVLTKVGPTRDWNANPQQYPNAVREWCINTAAVDLPGHAVLVNNEDGVLYRWNLDTNALDGSIRLNSGIGQAYTPTLIGPSGMVYAVSNARLYAVGN